MAKNNFVLNLIQIIFTIVGICLIAGGYLAGPLAKTKDGFPLDTFLYSLGAFFILFPLILFGSIRYFMRRTAERQAWLRENGIKGKARVVSMHQTNVYINRVPQMRLNLHITTSLGEQFDASYKKAIPMHYYNTIRPDVDLPVYIDPADRTKLFLDFEQAWTNVASQNSATNFSNPFNQQ